MDAVKVPNPNEPTVASLVFPMFGFVCNVSYNPHRSPFGSEESPFCIVASVRECESCF